MKRLHDRIDPSEPKFKLYCQIISEINDYLRNLIIPNEIIQKDIKQAIGSALMAETANYFGNIWCIPKDQFVQMAAEEYDLHQKVKSQ